jgi:hypothetical protein
MRVHTVIRYRFQVGCRKELTRRILWTLPWRTAGIRGIPTQIGKDRLHSGDRAVSESSMISCHTAMGSQSQRNTTPVCQVYQAFCQRTRTYLRQRCAGMERRGAQSCKKTESDPVLLSGDRAVSESSMISCHTAMGSQSQRNTTPVCQVKQVGCRKELTRRILWTLPWRTAGIRGIPTQIL